MCVATNGDSLELLIKGDTCLLKKPLCFLILFFHIFYHTEMCTSAKFFNARYYFKQAGY